MDFMTRDVPSLHAALKNRAHAKVGDAIANLVFSLAKAKLAVDRGMSLDVRGSPKVPARVLRDALDIARARTGITLPVHGDEHAIADAAEAILSYAWATGTIDIAGCVATIAGVVRGKDISRRKDEWAAFSEGFATILAAVLPVLA